MSAAGVPEAAVVEDDASIPVSAKASAYPSRPLSRVQPKPWAMTTHGRPAAVVRVPVLAGMCQAAQVTPWLVKVTSFFIVLPPRAPTKPSGPSAEPR